MLNKNTRISVAESLRSLMSDNLFEKITIKQICDNTGIIRATFYNYFEDKYSCLNWIVYHDFIEQNSKTIEKSDLISVIANILRTVDQYREFYTIAYNDVNGQNSFDDMVKSTFVIMLHYFLKKCRKRDVLSQYSDEILARYYTETLAFIVKSYVFQRSKDMTFDYMIRLSEDLLAHSLLDLTKSI